MSLEPLLHDMHEAPGDAAPGFDCSSALATRTGAKLSALRLKNSFRCVVVRRPHHHQSIKLWLGRVASNAGSKHSAEHSRVCQALPFQH